MNKKTFPAGGFQLSNFEFKPEIMGNALGGVGAARDVASLGDSLSRLNEWLWACLAAVAPNAPEIFVLFDELDHGFDPGSTDYMDRVTGLLIAVRTVSRELKSIAARLYPVAFPRSDIYDALHFGDKNKLTEANVAFSSGTRGWSTAVVARA